MTEIITYVTQSSDDGNSDSGSWLTDQGDPFFFTAGSGSLNAGIRFSSVSIPQGCIVDSAVFNAKCYGYWGTPLLLIDATLSDNAAAFSNGDLPTAGNFAIPVTQAPGTIDEVLDPYEVVDIPVRGFIQSIVDRSGWSNGSAQRLIVADDGGGGGDFMDFRDYEGSASYAQALTINYTVATCPAYESFSTNDGFGSSITINVPSGTTDGDFLVAWISCNNTTIGTPSGWTKVSQATSSVGTAAGLYYREATSSDTSFTWTSTSLGVRGTIVRVSGATTFDTASVSASTSSTPNAPNITTGADNAIVIMFAVGQYQFYGWNEASTIDLTTTDGNSHTAGYAKQSSAGTIGTDFVTSNYNSSASFVVGSLSLYAVNDTFSGTGEGTMTMGGSAVASSQDNVNSGSGILSMGGSCEAIYQTVRPLATVSTLTTADVWQYDTDLTLDWSVDSGSANGARSIAANSSGQVAVCGDTLVGVAKYDTNGNLMWSNTSHGASLHAVAIDEAGYVYVGGEVSSSRTTYKLDKDTGSTVWFANHGVSVQCITVDSSGNVYTGGTVFASSATTRKYNASGTLQNSANHGATVFGIAVDGSGNVYTAGTRSSSLTTRKYNSSLSEQWSHDDGGGVSNGISIDVSDNYVVVAANGIAVRDLDGNSQYTINTAVRSVRFDVNENILAALAGTGGHLVAWDITPTLLFTTYKPRIAAEEAVWLELTVATGSGSAILSGSAVSGATYVFTGSGSIVIGGDSVDTTDSYSSSGNGEIVVSGSAVNSPIFFYMPTGTIVIDGAARVLPPGHYESAGGMLLSGNNEVLTVSYNYIPSGSIVIAGEASTEQTYHYQAASGFGIFYSGYRYRKPLQVAKETVTGTLSNFPVLIRATLDDYTLSYSYESVGSLSTTGNSSTMSVAYAYAGSGSIVIVSDRHHKVDGEMISLVGGYSHTSNGNKSLSGSGICRVANSRSDFAFYNSNGLIPFEVESYEGLTGTVTAWVKLSLSDVSDTDLYIHYGYNESDNSNASDTWQRNFKGVYHLTDTGITYNDSTSNNKDGAAGRSGLSRPHVDDGLVSDCQFFSGTEFIDLPSDGMSVVDDITVGALIYIDSDILIERIVFSRGKNTATQSWNFALGHDDRGRAICKVRTVANNLATMVTATGSTILNRNQWYLIHGNWNRGDGVTVYVNGVADGITSDSGTTLISGGTSYISGLNDGGYLLETKVGEVRIADTSRSAAWIKAEYDTIFSDFISQGVQQSSLSFNSATVIQGYLGFAGAGGLVSGGTSGIDTQQNYNATGEVTSGGNALATVLLPSIGGGSMLTSGTATPTPDYDYVGGITSGIVGSGTAELVANYVTSGSGTISADGTATPAAVYSTQNGTGVIATGGTSEGAPQMPHAASGSVTLSGTAEGVYGATGGSSGTITAGGTGTVTNVVYHALGTGTLTSGGTPTLEAIYADLGGGSIAASGTATPSAIYATQEGNGQAATSGTATATCRYAYVSGGTISISGLGSEALNLPFVASGAVVFSGSADVANVYPVTGGTIDAGGIAALTATYAYIGSGGMGINQGAPIPISGKLEIKPVIGGTLELYPVISGKLQIKTVITGELNIG